MRVADHTRVDIDFMFPELLWRLRMHTVAAYVRKYSHSDEVRQSSQLQTTIYSSCGQCGKAIMQPTAGQTNDVGRSSRRSGYNYCFRCKKPTIECTIWYIYNFLIANSLSDYWVIVTFLYEQISSSAQSAHMEAIEIAIIGITC